MLVIARRAGPAFALSLTMLLAAPAGAAWIPLGNPVCTAPGAQRDATSVPDGAGGMFVVWRDQRRGSTFDDLYATRVLADGSIAPGWPANGLALAATGGVNPPPSPVADGAGGLIVVWFDRSTYQARMVHVDASGVPAPGFPAGGKILPVTVGGPSGYLVRATGDGAGGAYLLWNRFGPSADVLYLSRLTGSGDFASGWNSMGVSQASSDPFNPSTGFTQATLLADPAGGAFVGAVWPIEDFPSGSHNVGLVRRTLASGAAGFTTPAVSGPAALALAADGSGGVFAAWRTSPARIQHHLANGSAAWPEPTAAPVADGVIADGGGGVYLFGRPAPADRLVLHRRQADGSLQPGWPPDGVEVSPGGPYWAYAAARSGDRVYACWTIGDPLGATDLRAAAVTPDGELAPGWLPGGTLVCGAPNQQVLTSMMPCANGDVAILWTDGRSGNEDVYATLLQPNAPVTLGAPLTPPAGAGPLAFAAGSPSPNPADGHVRVTFMMPAAAPASLELVDVSGRVLERVAPEPRAGVQSVSLRVAHLAPGLYWVRVAQGAHVAVRRLSVLH